MGASHLTAAQRRWIYRLGAEGWSLREIAREVGFSHQTVWLLLRKGSSRPARSGCWDPGPGRLPLAALPPAVAGWLLTLYPAFGGSHRSDDLCATASCEPRPYTGIRRPSSLGARPRAGESRTTTYPSFCRGWE